MYFNFTQVCFYATQCSVWRIHTKSKPKPKSTYLPLPTYMYYFLLWRECVKRFNWRRSTSTPFLNKISLKSERYCQNETQTQFGSVSHPFHYRMYFLSSTFPPFSQISYTFLIWRRSIWVSCALLSCPVTRRVRVPVNEYTVSLFVLLFAIQFTFSSRSHFHHSNHDASCAHAHLDAVSDVGYAVCC